jgi:hypothetical protein
MMYPEAGSNASIVGERSISKVDYVGISIQSNPNNEVAESRQKLM